MIARLSGTGSDENVPVTVVTQFENIKLCCAISAKYVTLTVKRTFHCLQMTEYKTKQVCIPRGQRFVDTQTMYGHKPFYVVEHLIKKL